MGILIIELFEGLKWPEDFSLSEDTRIIIKILELLFHYLKKLELAVVSPKGQGKNNSTGSRVVVQNEDNNGIIMKQ